MTPLLETLLIAIGLAMDAFAVSVSSGVGIKKMRITHALTMAAFFGFFQALMPVLGWFGGLFLRDFIQNYAHWIAFLLLAGIGGKMIYESFQQEEEGKEKSPHGFYMLLTLSIATSIDAMAVGVTYSLLKCSIWKRAALIGIVTFLISFLGAELGKKIGGHTGARAELLGGLILIGIGLKILLTD